MSRFGRGSNNGGHDELPIRLSNMEPGMRDQAQPKGRRARKMARQEGQRSPSKRVARGVGAVLVAAVGLASADVAQQAIRDKFFNHKLRSDQVDAQKFVAHELKNSTCLPALTGTLVITNQAIVRETPTSSADYHNVDKKLVPDGQVANIPGAITVAWNGKNWYQFGENQKPLTGTAVPGTYEDNERFVEVGSAGVSVIGAKAGFYACASFDMAGNLYVVGSNELIGWVGLQPADIQDQQNRRMGGLEALTSHATHVAPETK